VIKKIKSIICEAVCNLFNIVPCICSHNCECKKRKDRYKK
jgi:hypothetical protein